MADSDIRGQIVDARGEGLVQGATVYLWLESSPNSVRTTTTDANGEYVFTKHRDADGTQKEWFVTAYYEDANGNPYSVVSKPGVSASLARIIPDSAVYQWNAKELTGFAAGDTVGTRPSEIGSLDLTGSGTYRTDFNNNASVEYDGTDDSHEATATNISQKYVVFVVLRPDFTSSTSSRHTPWSGTDGSSTLLWDNQEGAWEFFAGNPINGSTTADRRLITVVADGANSLIREDGAQTGSGDAGTNALAPFVFGYNPTTGSRYFPGDLPFAEIHDGDVDGGISSREEDIADKFDITI